MDKVTVMETGDESAGSEEYSDLPEQYVTIDQIVAGNIRHWRKAASITQEELGQRIGWSAANVSAAERSADSDRDRRRFDAQTITSTAFALGVPIIALFLPPPDDGVDHHYMFRCHDQDDKPLSMGDLLYLTLPDPGNDSPVMDAYRARLETGIASYLDTTSATQVARIFRDSTDAEVTAARAARLRLRQTALIEAADDLRARQAELLGAASEFGQIAGALEDSVKEGQS